jgi:hypothetical protein
VAHKPHCASQNLLLGRVLGQPRHSPALLGSAHHPGRIQWRSLYGSPVISAPLRPESPSSSHHSKVQCVNLNELGYEFAYTLIPFELHGSPKLFGSKYLKEKRTQRSEVMAAINLL